MAISPSVYPGTVYSQVVGTSVVELLPMAPNRVGLIFTGPNAGIVYIHTQSGVSSTNGIALSPGQSLYLDNAMIGDVIKATWYAVADAANRTVGYIECLSG